MIIRTATMDDLEQIVMLLNAAYRGKSSEMGWTSESHLLGGERTNMHAMKKTLNEPNTFMELAFEGQKLIGTVLLQYPSEGVGYLGMLTVDPTLQARGTGKVLIEHAENKAREKKCHTMVMTVITLRTKLLEFYERRGYKRTDRLIPFRKEDGFIGEPKVEGLELVELRKKL